MVNQPGLALFEVKETPAGGTTPRGMLGAGDFQIGMKDEIETVKNTPGQFIDFNNIETP